MSAGIAGGHDLGQEVTFAGLPAADRFLAGPRTLAFLLGPSDPLDPFDAVLLQGQLQAPSGAQMSFEVSVQREGSWTSWQRMELHRYPNGRFWARVDTGPARGSILLRLVLDGDGTLDLHSVEAVTLEREPQGTPWLEQERPQQDLGAFQGPYHPRAEWDARPPLEPFVPDEPFRITLHHTSGPRPERWDEVVTEIRFLQDLHQRGRGWNDIGYHFVIDGSGRIFEGRPQTVLGAHTLANNAGNLGVAFMGNFNQDLPFSTHPTGHQIEAFLRLGRFLMDRYALSTKRLRGHRDYRATSCPGDHLYPRLPWLREELGRNETLEALPTLKILRLPWAGAAFPSVALPATPSPAWPTRP